jgi:hypothetical protein
MSLLISRTSVAIVFFLVGAQYTLPYPCKASTSSLQSSSQKSSQTKTQKLANPLNDLLDEAQQQIDSSQFEAAIATLQKFIAERP